VKQLTLGSLFDGIGGFPLAAQRNGIKTVWASEIEPNCIAITKRHFPHIQHMGDLTKLHGGELPPVDIISFGSPCQDLSTAGAQRGIDGERSGLFHHAIRIIYEMRLATNGRYPTFIIWENVPGAFGSNNGRDFRTVLEKITNARIPMPNSGRWANAGMAGGSAGGASVAWRQLDAQYWGVSQRRKRIFLVGDFRADRAGQILFGCESVLGYVEKSGAEGKDIAAAVASGIDDWGRLGNGESIVDFGQSSSRIHINANVARTLTCTSGGGSGCPTGIYFMHEGAPETVDFGRTADRIYLNADTARTITASNGGGGSKTGLYLLREGEPITQAINLQVATRHNKLGERTGYGLAENGEPAYTLQAAHSKEPDEQGRRVLEFADAPTANGSAVSAQRKFRHGVFVVYPIRDPSLNQSANGFIISDNGAPAPTPSTVDRHAVAVCFAPGGHGGFTEGVGTLRARMGKSGSSSSNLLIVFQKMAYSVRYALRRLTTLECERLQGFPDYWTMYKDTGTTIADTPRYAALGNSLAVPCAERVMRGIVAVCGGLS